MSNSEIDKKTFSQSKMPDVEENGFVPTLNKMGYMTSTLDPYSQEFVDYAVRTGGPVLDVGAAYGIASLPAIEGGAKVFVNDLDRRHLEILKNRTTEQFKNNVELVPGRFPDELELPQGSLRAILICRVLHFFDGSLLERSLSKAYEWLESGGKLFVVSETPYLKNFKEFIPIFEERKASGQKYPGFIEDVMEVAPERGKHLPKSMHFYDPDILSQVFREIGFEIEKTSTIARPDFPEDLQLDGRESVGIVGVKSQ